jgi:hypothetical protein
VQVGDQHGMKPLRGQVADHFFESRELGAVDGEGAVLVLIIDVQVDGIGGNFFVAESFSDFVHACFRFVTVTRLLKA